MFKKIVEVAKNNWSDIVGALLMAGGQIAIIMMYRKFVKNMEESYEDYVKDCIED